MADPRTGLGLATDEAQKKRDAEQKARETEEANKRAEEIKSANNHKFAKLLGMNVNGWVRVDDEREIDRLNREAIERLNREAKEKGVPFMGVHSEKKHPKFPPGLYEYKENGKTKDSVFLDKEGNVTPLDETGNFANHVPAMMHFLASNGSSEVTLTFAPPHGGMGLFGINEFKNTVRETLKQASRNGQSVNFDDGTKKAIATYFSKSEAKEIFQKRMDLKVNVEKNKVLLGLNPPKEKFTEQIETIKENGKSSMGKTDPQVEKEIQNRMDEIDARAKKEAEEKVVKEAKETGEPKKEAKVDEAKIMDEKIDLLEKEQEKLQKRIDSAYDTVQKMDEIFEAYKKLEGETGELIKADQVADSFSFNRQIYTKYLEVMGKKEDLTKEESAFKEKFNTYFLKHKDDRNNLLDVLGNELNDVKRCANILATKRTELEGKLKPEDKSKLKTLEDRSKEFDKKYNQSQSKFNGVHQYNNRKLPVPTAEPASTPALKSF